MFAVTPSSDHIAALHRARITNSPTRSFERREASKAGHRGQDAHYSLSLAADRLSRFQMQADGYLAALRESDENTEVVAVALKEGPRRIIARIARRGIVLAS